MDRFKELAEKTHFKVFNSPIWHNNAQAFAKSIVEECIQCCGSQADRKNIRKNFGFPIESDVKYSCPENTNSVESQYKTSINIPNL